MNIDTINAKQNLNNFLESDLTPMYIRGYLGAQNVPGFENKCRTSFSVCREPENIAKNLEKISKLLNLSESDRETNMLLKLKELYFKYIKTVRESFNYDFEIRKFEILELESKLKDVTFFRTDNATIFEDYAKLLKVLQNYTKKYNKTIHNPNFNSKTFDIYNSIKEIKTHSYFDFKNMRFFYNISIEQ